MGDVNVVNPKHYTTMFFLFCFVCFFNSGRPGLIRRVPHLFKLWFLHFFHLYAFFTFMYKFVTEYDLKIYNK